MTPLMSKDLTSAWQEGKKENCYLLLLHTVPKFQVFSKKNPHFFQSFQSAKIINFSA